MDPRDWHRRDEARRLTREHQQLLLEGAPRDGAIRDRGEILPTMSVDRSEQIREQTLEYLQERYGYMKDAPPGLANHPWRSGSLSVDSFAVVWREPSGDVVAGAIVTGGTATAIPDELHEIAPAYDAGRETPEERECLLAWWRQHHHEVERGEVEGIAVRADLPGETRRDIVRQIQYELGRHRVERRLCFAAGTERGVSFARLDAFALSEQGARSLNRQSADLRLTTAVASAGVRNPDALVGLVRMPDTGRLLTQAEILRGVMDVAHGGGEQFHIEALAVKEAIRPLARDPEAYQRRFGFEPPTIPGVPFLVRTQDGRGVSLHFEDALGNRLEEWNERCQAGNRTGPRSLTLLHDEERGRQGLGRPEASVQEGSGRGVAAGAGSPARAGGDRTDPAGNQGVGRAR